ncbi:MAG: TlpA family protein disulfide reductase [Firmicutes bacterium]|nr:TlpA family protein disulfide reductase [Bacillota bacterium]
MADQSATGRRSVSGRNSKRRTRQARKRRRLLVPIITVIIVVIFGTVLGLHLSSTATQSNSNTKMGSTKAVGLRAPAGILTTISGRQLNVASLRGKPTLLWFVSTWCSSCQAGTQTMAQNISRLQADGVRVVEVELYQDLGQSGPSITSFGKQLAGAHYGDPDWIFATSSFVLTRTYDPASYLDIYYLINAKGKIVYVNGSPSATMPDILREASTL